MTDEISGIMDDISPLEPLRPARYSQILMHTFKAAISAPTTLVAAGCAFYATLGLFPALSAIISTYGLVFDLQDVAHQLNALHRLLPEAAFTLIQSRINLLVSAPSASLTLRLIISILFALWTTSTATRGLLAALNVAYRAKEKRNFLRFQATALCLTGGTLLGVILSLAVLVAMPIIIDWIPVFLPVPPPAGSIELAVKAGGPLIITLFVMCASTVLYTYGPCRKPTALKQSVPGAFLATLLWITGSMAFSYYVGNIANYGSTYGPLGAIVALMMWFFLSAWSVMIGAELNAALEKNRSLKK
ncbi:MAG: YihY/virulence factor BrkB family protein [Acetobacter sp.]|nr:YihY/virulence factor BrkB family protein [Acetobacter sp.]